MAKITLEFEEDFEFDLIGICSHVKDYRLVWELNANIKLDLAKKENYRLKIKDIEQTYSFFEYLNEEDAIDYFLINNRSENGLLVPEEKNCDYLLLIKGYYMETPITALVNKIAKLKHVLTAYQIEVNSLKSKENLLF